MKITGVKVYRVAPKSNYVKVETDEGICGWGEPVVEGRSRATAVAVKELGEQLIGMDPENIEDLFNVMYRGNFYQGGPVLCSAISGIEQALWDIKGKKYGVPVYQLIGGAAKEKQKVYAWIHGETPEELAADALNRLSEGYHYGKMCICNEMEWICNSARIDKAIAMFATVKEAVGDRMEIGIDFHGRVHKTVALTLMKKLEEFNPLFIEEPLLPFNEDDLVELKRHTHLPIATGERLFTRWDFKRLLKTGAVDIIQPDLSHAGGIWEVRKIAAMAECFDVTVAPHCPLGALAFSSCIHLDVATPNSFIQEQIVGVHNAVNGGGLEIEDRIETDDSQGYVSCDTYIKNEKGLFEFEDGYVKLPKNPGLGPIIDEERLAAANNGDFPLWQQPLYRMDDGTATQW